MPDLRLKRGAFARLCAAAIATAIICGAAAMAPARAADAPAACERSYASAVEIGRNAAAGVSGAAFRDYAGSDAHALMAEINSHEPATDWRADHLLVVNLPGTPVIIGVVEGDCLTHTVMADPAVWREAVTRRLGSPL